MKNRKVDLQNPFHRWLLSKAIDHHRGDRSKGNNQRILEYALNWVEYVIGRKDPDWTMTRKSLIAQYKYYNC